jgi:hypothetical protein
MRKTSIKYRVVGQGDDVISEWLSPLADYYSLTIALDYCEQVGVDFPIKKLISTTTQKHGQPAETKPASTSFTQG